MTLAASGADISIPWASGAAQERVAQIQAASDPGTPADLDRALRAVLTHVRRMDDEGLVLYAGTNVMSNAVAAAHDDRVGIRPSLGDPAEKIQPGLEDLEILEVLTTRAVAATMRARHADARVQSATLGNLAVYAGLTEVGATIASLPRWAGGHFSHHSEGAAGIRGHRVVELPYDAAAYDVDVDALPAFLERERPELVVLGGAVMLFPHRLDRIAEAVKPTGARTLYDASHVAGLIAGGRFQDPLAEGRRRGDVLDVQVLRRASRRRDRHPRLRGCRARLRRRLPRPHRELRRRPIPRARPRRHGAPRRRRAVRRALH